jgi:hypothetical protein
MPRLRHGVVAAVCALAVALGAATAGAATPSTDQLSSFVCQKALDPPARAVSVQAVMRPVPGTAKMQMRFELMRQWHPGARFMVVRGRFLDSWLSPQDPTLGQRPNDVWIVKHPVVNLTAPATYRFRVSFRWTGAQGQHLATAMQTTAGCYQPELRPDLLVRSLNVSPQGSGTDDTYTAVIANRGQTGAGTFQVVLAGDVGTPQTATVGGITAHSVIRQRFVAPACSPGTSLTVTVDPAHTIDEYNYANNSLALTCPASNASG